MARCNGHWFHHWEQVEEKPGVYSHAQAQTIRETPFAELEETFHLLTFRCVYCGKMGYHKVYSWVHWNLKPITEADTHGH